MKVAMSIVACVMFVSSSLIAKAASNSAGLDIAEPSASLSSSLAATLDSDTVTVSVNGKNYGCTSDGSTPNGHFRFCRCKHPNSSFDGKLVIVEHDQSGNWVADIAILGDFGSVDACQEVLYRHPSCKF